MRELPISATIGLMMSGHGFDLAKPEAGHAG